MGLDSMKRERLLTDFSELEDFVGQEVSYGPTTHAFETGEKRRTGTLSKSTDNVFFIKNDQSIATVTRDIFEARQIKVRE